MTRPVVLSKQQWIVLCCWAGGMTVRQTALSLLISTETVKEYRKRIRVATNTQNPHLMKEIPDHA